MQHRSTSNNCNGSFFAFPRCLAVSFSLQHCTTIRGTSVFSKSIKLSAALTALVLAPSLAFAHTGVGDTAGFVHGFSHPLSGLDHVLAMVMVGVLAWQLGGRAVWIVPSTFVGVMAAGGALGMMGIAIPFVEAGIALSVLVLGAVIAFNIRAPVAAAAAVVGLFAIFHGLAHGAEMPAAAGGMAYAAGFMIATVALHFAGITMGYGLAKMGETRGAFVTRASGGVAAVAGIALLSGLI